MIARRRQDARAPGDEGRRHAIRFALALVAGLEEARVLGQDPHAVVVRRGDRQADAGRQERVRRDPSTSPGRGDSRWLAYAKPTGANDFSADLLYSAGDGAVDRGLGRHDRRLPPAFDPEGKYLYFISRRTLTARRSARSSSTSTFTATDKIYAVTLRDTTCVAGRAARATRRRARRPTRTRTRTRKDGKARQGQANDPARAAPAWTDRSRRAWRSASPSCRSPAGRYGALAAFKGKLLLYCRRRPTRSRRRRRRRQRQLHCVRLREARGQDRDLGRRRRLRRLEGRRQGAVPDGRRRSASSRPPRARSRRRQDRRPSTLMATVDPRAEWMQMFNEAWRLERDFYYDPTMGGLDWKAIGERYRQLVPYVAHRADLNYILGELIGELSTSHTYVGGGDMPRGAEGRRRAARRRLRARRRERPLPLHEDLPRARLELATCPRRSASRACDVREGDFLLAVNGVPVRAPQNVYAAFVGHRGQADRDHASARRRTTPSRAPTRSSRSRTRRRCATRRGCARTARRWRRPPAAASPTSTCPNTATRRASRSSRKQYYPQVDKQGIIVDERFNGGGFIPDFFVERLMRKTWVYWSHARRRRFPHAADRASTGPSASS